jgi:hypothetical protein
MGSSIRSSTTSSERSAARSTRAGHPWRGPVIAAVAALLLAAGLAGQRRGLLGPGRQGQGPRQDHDDADRQAALERELAGLKARLRALERSRQIAERGAPVVSAPPAETAPVATASGAASPAPRPARPADEEDERRYFAALEERLAGEPRDTAWAQAAEDKLRRSGDGFGARLTVEAIRCGRATCRLDIKREPGRPDAAETLQELVRRAVRVVPQAVVQTTDDPARLVIYLARENEGPFPPLVGREPGTRPPTGWSEVSVPNRRREP